MYCKPPISKKKEWVLDQGPQVQANGEVNYEKYGHAICMPGPVISAKTGKNKPAITNLSAWNGQPRTTRSLQGRAMPNQQKVQQPQENALNFMQVQSFNPQFQGADSGPQSQQQIPRRNTQNGSLGGMNRQSSAQAIQQQKIEQLNAKNQQLQILQQQNNAQRGFGVNIQNFDPFGNGFVDQQNQEKPARNVGLQKAGQNVLRTNSENPKTQKGQQKSSRQPVNLPRPSSGTKRAPAMGGVAGSNPMSNPVLQKGLGQAQGFLGNSYSAKPLGGYSGVPSSAVRTPVTTSVRSTQSKIQAPGSRASGNGAPSNGIDLSIGGTGQPLHSNRAKNQLQAAQFGNY